MIIGVDPAMRSLAMVTETEARKFMLKPRKDQTRRFELQSLEDSLADFIAANRSRFDEDIHIFVESPIQGGSGNVQTSVKIAMTVGSIFTAGTTAEMVAPSSWKMEVMGKGNGHADKSLVKRWLETHHPLYAERCGDDQDLVDASCIYLYGVKKMGLG